MPMHPVIVKVTSYLEFNVEADNAELAAEEAREYVEMRYPELVCEQMPDIEVMTTE